MPKILNGNSDPRPPAVKVSAKQPSRLTLLKKHPPNATKSAYKQLTDQQKKVVKNRVLVQ